MSEKLNICQIECNNPILATEYADGISYAEALEAAFKKVELTWEMMLRESRKNEQIWTDFYETRDRVRKEIVRLRRRITILDRGGGRQNILRHAYLYRDLAEDPESEIEIDEILAQIKTLESKIRNKLIRAQKTERFEARQKFSEALEEYKGIIAQYCIERIRRFDLDFSPKDSVAFRWKWDLSTITVYYGGDNNLDRHGHAEFSTDGLRVIYLRPAFWEHGDWLIRKGKFKNAKLVEEEWPEQESASNETAERQTSREVRKRVNEEKSKYKRNRNVVRRRHCLVKS